MAEKTVVSETLFIPVQTRLQIPPARSGTVIRSHLYTLLNQGLQLDKKLILVSSPAGSGKTTLVANWARSIQNQDTFNVGWLQFEEGENSPLHFWSYFIAALQTIYQDIGTRSNNLLRANSNLPAESFLPYLINELSEKTSPSILILDDFQEINNPIIQIGLTYWLDHQPENFHLVIVTRSDPFLPLARFRVYNQIMELRGKELSFELEETRVFVSDTMNLSITERQLEDIQNCTEGWIAGIQLACLSIKQHSSESQLITQSIHQNRYLADYWVEEILKKLTKNQRDFLVQCSILNLLCADICDYMLETSNSTEQLIEFERENLFIAPADQTFTWFRLHKLFADLLQTRLPELYSDSHIRKLHERVSIWYQEHGMIDESISHAIFAQSYEFAWNMVKDVGFPRIFRGDSAKVLNWCNQFPEDWKTQRVELLIISAAAKLAAAQFSEVKPLISQIEHLLPEVADAGSDFIHEEATDSDLIGQALAIRATADFNLGEYEKSISFAQRALNYLSPKNNGIRSLVALDLADALCVNNDFEAAKPMYQQAIDTALTSRNYMIVINARCMIGRIMVWQGKLGEAKQELINTISFAKEVGLESLPVLGLAEQGLAEIAFERNEIVEARSYALTSLFRFQQWGHIRHQVNSKLLLLQLDIQEGKLEESQDLLNELILQIQKENGRSLSNAVYAAAAQLSIVRKELFSAREYLVKADILKDEELDGEANHQVNQKPISIGKFAYAILGSYYYHINDAQRAICILDKQNQVAERIGHQSIKLKTLILEGLVYQKSGEKQKAIEMIEQAVRLASKEGFIQSFVHEGEKSRQLLLACQAYLIRSKKIDPVLEEYFSQVLVAFSAHDDDQEIARTNSLISFQKYIGSNLSDRELEVLRLVSAGLTNEEIARELIVSLNTVKTHLKRIFGKFGVNSRRDAVQIAKKYQWIK